MLTKFLSLSLSSALESSGDATNERAHRVDLSIELESACAMLFARANAKFARSLAQRRALGELCAVFAVVRSS